MVVRCAFSPPPPNGIPLKYKGLKPRGLEDPHDRRAAPRIVPSLASTPKNGTEALAEEHVRRENAIHTQTRGVCVCGCVSKQKGKPCCSTGGGLEDRMAIQRCVCVCVCVCVHVYGKRETILFHRWGAGSPSCLALENHKTAGGISCSTGGGGGRIHHDVHYLLKYKST